MIFKIKKYTDQSTYQYSLFGNIINRVNCSYLNLKPINYDNIQLLIDILLLGLWMLRAMIMKNQKKAYL